MKRLTKAALLFIAQVSGVVVGGVWAWIVGAFALDACRRADIAVGSILLAALIGTVIIVAVIACVYILAVLAFADWGMAESDRIPGVGEVLPESDWPRQTSERENNEQETE